MRHGQVLRYISCDFVFAGFSNPGGFDVVVSSWNTLDVAGELSFPYRRPDRTQLTVQQVLALGPKQNVSIVLL